MLRIRHTCSFLRVMSTPVESSIYSCLALPITTLSWTTKGDALFFFRVDEHRDYISGSHRWTRRVNEPRFYANATRVNIIFLDRFCDGRHRRLIPATFFISVQWRAFSPQSGNQRFVTLHYPLRSDARRRFHTLRAFFHGCVRTSRGGVTRSSPHGRLIRKKLRTVR